MIAKDLIKQLRKLPPDTPVVLMSCDTEDIKDEDLYKIDNGYGGLEYYLVQFEFATEIKGRYEDDYGKMKEGKVIALY